MVFVLLRLQLILSSIDIRTTILVLYIIVHKMRRLQLACSADFHREKVRLVPASTRDNSGSEHVKCFCGRMFVEKVLILVASLVPVYYIRPTNS